MKLTPAAYARLAGCLALLATIGVALAAAPPLLEAQGGAGASTAAFAGRLLFAPLCHQLPGRAFHFDGHPMALCARCTGLYAGFAAGCWGLALAGLAGWRRLPSSPMPLLLALAPGFVQWLAQRSDPAAGAGGAPARALTGALAGMMVAAYLLPAAARWAEERRERHSRLVRAEEKA